MCNLDSTAILCFSKTHLFCFVPQFCLLSTAACGAVALTFTGHKMLIRLQLKAISGHLASQVAALHQSFQNITGMLGCNFMSVISCVQALCSSILKLCVIAKELWDMYVSQNTHFFTDMPKAVDYHKQIHVVCGWNGPIENEHNAGSSQSPV